MNREDIVKTAPEMTALYQIAEDKLFVEDKEEIRMWLSSLNNLHHLDANCLRSLNESFPKENRIDGQETIYGLIVDDVPFQIREAEMGFFMNVKLNELKDSKDPKMILSHFMSLMDLAVSDSKAFAKTILFNKIKDGIEIETKKEYKTKI